MAAKIENYWVLILKSNQYLQKLQIMPTSIPYDHPSLILGNVVDTKVLDLLHQIVKLQSNIDIAQDKLNSTISLKRNLTMTVSELMGLGIDISELTDKIKKIDASILTSAKNYLDAKLSGEDNILSIRDQIAEIEITQSLESPVDFGKSSIKLLPLSSETLKLDIQYFSFEDKDIESKDILSNIENYVKESTDNLGSKSSKLAKATSSQIFQQQQNQNLTGTLIITASCTHKNVAIIEPLFIDADKAIEYWNSKDLTIKLIPNKATMAALLKATNTLNQESISVITGASYGSSFIGMVHLLKNEIASINPSDEVIQSLQEKIRLGGWLENATGGFGTEESVLNEVKRFLNAHSINSHVSLITMGAIPSISSNRLMAGLKELNNSDVAKTKKSVDSLSDTSEKSVKSLEIGNEKSKDIKRVTQIENARDQSIVTGLGAMDSKANNVMDINSLMTAFENYITVIKAKEDVVGTPVNFYLKNLTAQNIAKLWVSKYFPENAPKDEV